MSTIHRLLPTACCVILLLLLGCSQKGPQVVPAEGIITFGGGPWPKAGASFFVVDSPSPGLPSRPAMGEFDTNGKLTVTTFKTGDGLLPGKYKIGVECWETAPAMGSPTPARSYIPDRYRSANTSGLMVTVEPYQAVVKLKLDVAKK